MTPRRRPPSRRRPGRPAARPGRPLMFASLGVLVVVALLMVVQRVRERSRPAHAPAVEILPAAAHDSATSLAGRGRFRESLPYFRSALRSPAPGDWKVHFAFATALSNVTLQFSTRSGVMVPETRSSAERVALMTAAIAEYEIAARQAPDGVSRAGVLAQWANLLYVYGFPWDAFVAYREANLADPANTTYAARGDALMDVLHDPEHATPAPVPAGVAPMPEGPVLPGRRE